LVVLIDDCLLKELSAENIMGRWGPIHSDVPLSADRFRLSRVPDGDLSSGRIGEEAHPPRFAGVDRFHRHGPAFLKDCLAEASASST
jgi:hypothetical protein